MPLQACSQQKTLNNNELKSTYTSSICSSPAAFPVLHGDSESRQSFVHGVQSVSNLGHSTSRGDNEQWDESNTTFLSCTKGVSAKVSATLSLLASRVKGLCKIITTTEDENKIFIMALRSTGLGKTYRQSAGPGKKNRYCDLLIDGVCVSCGQGVTRMLAKHSSHANAVKLLQKPYLHLEESSPSDNAFKLVCSQTPSENKSYDIVTRLDVASSHLHLPVIHVINCKGQKSANVTRLVDCFKHIASTVRTIVHVLKTVRGNNKVIDIAVHRAKVPKDLQIVGGGQEPFCCSLFIDGVLVASSEAHTMTAVKDSVYASAIEIFHKPYLHLEGSEHGGPIRLVGYEEPFHEVLSGLLPSTQNDTNELDPDEAQFISEENLPSCESQNSVLPTHEDHSEGTRNSRSLVLCTQNSVLLAADGNKKYPSATEVSPPAKRQRQNVNSCAILGTGSELPSAMSVLLDRDNQPDAGNKPDVETQILDDSGNKHKLPEQRKTVVIARSHKDRSRLVNRFRSLADISKDICAMFKIKKDAEKMVDMALRMSHMCLKSDIEKLPGGHVRFRMSIDDIVVAVAEGYKADDAGKIAYGIAAKLFCMPYLCLEENHDAVQLLGSEEPFMESDDKVNSCSSRGFWLDSTFDAANTEEKKDLHNPVPYTADLSKLVIRFHGLACRVKAICNAKTKPISSFYGILMKALGDCNMQMSKAWVRGDGNHYKLFIDGVWVASGNARKKKQASCAANTDAVELLRKPYLRLQENAESNWCLKLIGSDQPFVDVSSGDLPYEEKYIATDARQCVEITKESLGSRDTAKSSKQHSADGTEVSGKVGPETCSKNSSDLSLANDAMQADDRGICETQMPVSSHSTHILELVNEFSALARRVKCISGSLPEVHSDADIIEMALADTQMQKRRLFIWMNSLSLLCELCVDGISVSYGEGGTREEAKEAAYSAAVDLLRKPYIQLQEYPGFSHRYSLVGSDDKFPAVSSASELPYRQYFVVADNRHEIEKQTIGCQSAMLDQNLECRSGSNETLSQQHLQRLPAEDLTDFIIILHGHVEKDMCLDILQQSADFNKWPLTYGLSKVKGSNWYHCRLTLGRHMLADVDMPSKNRARKAAAEQALSYLTSMCYSVKVKKNLKKRKKKSEISAKSLTRQQVLIQPLYVQFSIA